MSRSQSEHGATGRGTSKEQLLLNVRLDDCLVWERIFTEDDVRAFTRLSGDAGAHHEQRDASGRLMVHGLLTATLPTKIGGDINYLAREMEFEFHRPVFAGERIRCEVTITRIEREADRATVDTAIRCLNESGREVMTGRTRGVVLDGPDRGGRSSGAGPPGPLAPDRS